MLFQRIRNFSTLLILTAITFLLSLGSCVSRKSSAYFQNESSGNFPKFDPILQIDDLLSIQVSAQSPELYEMFNPFSSGGSGANAARTNAVAGYMIDATGHIDFPVIGQVKLAGLKKEEAAQVLKDKLKVYLKDPIISIGIQNYRVTVLGDVKSPGSFLIPGEKIGFAEALGMAGDLNLTAIRNNILLIRNQNGQKKSYRIDLTRQDFLHSPDLCYLRQGDIIYVEPNRSQRNSGAINSKLGVLLSIATVILTSITLITR